MNELRRTADTPSGAQADSGVVRLAQGFARRMALLAKGNGADEVTCRYVWRASLAVSLATAEGHVCVPLGDLLDTQASGELFPGDAPSLAVCERPFSPVVCARGQASRMH